MDWLTSLLMGGQPGTIGSPTPPANPASPFDPVAGAPTPGGSGVNALDNRPQGQGQQSKDNALITALRGVASPPKPDVLKPSTPGQPRVAPIKGGALFDLLNQVSNPRLAHPAATTLGGALGIGRY